MSKDITSALNENLKCKDMKVSTTRTKNGSYLLFPEFTEITAENYRKLFGIEDGSEVFDEAFKIVTKGNGNEIDKISSVISSALLPLLVFYPLFLGKKGVHIKLNNVDDLNDVVFNKCYFEVKNKVRNSPSCVDVVLQSEDKKTLMFLESKLSEPYRDDDSEYNLPKGYTDLYKELKDILQCRLMDVKVEDNKVTLHSENGEKIYLEGVKQSISHLIGIVRGPQKQISKGYTMEYLEEYLDAYKEANRFYYGTILFNPSRLGVSDDKYSSYSELYTETIGRHGAEIIDKIKKKYDALKPIAEIVVLDKPLTYQDSIDKEYLKNLPPEIKHFYSLNASSKDVHLRLPSAKNT